MADPNPVLTPQPPGEEIVYRPISGLAIAGLGLSCLYAGLVLISTVVALIQGAPFFLPGWAILLAIAGVAVSLLAQRSIRFSEDTRAGLGLARWGLWLSVFTGLGYTAYFYFTGLALTQQANDFMLVKGADSGFFPRLQEGDPVEINTAFLLTLPEANRGKIDPKNERQLAELHDKGQDGKGWLSRFKENFLIRNLSGSGKTAKIEPLGVQSWKYEKRSYHVVRNYRVTTPTAIFHVVVPVQSSEGDAGSQRKWNVAFPQMALKMQLTPLGKALKNAGDLARLDVEAKVANLNRSQPFGEFTDITDWAKAAKGLYIHDLIKEIFKGPKERTHIAELLAEQDFPAWQVADGHLRFTFPFTLRFKGPADAPMVGEGVITLDDEERIAVDENNLPDINRFPELQRWKRPMIEFQRFGSLAMKGPMGK